MSEEELRNQRHPWLFVPTWHVVAGFALLVALSLYVTELLPWRAPKSSLVQVVGVVGSYFAVGIALAALGWRGQRPLLWALPVATLAFGVLALALLLSGWSHSPEVIAAGLIASAIVAPLPLVLGRARVPALLLLVLAAAALAVYDRWAPQERPTVVGRVMISALSDLDVVTYRGWLPGTRGQGGAIAAFRDGFLLVDGRGRFAQLVWGPNESLKVTPLPLRAPLNFSEFDADVLPEAPRTYFRVADIVLRDSGDRIKIVLSHHFWHRDRSCWTIRVSQTELAATALASQGIGNWTTVFEAQPCLPMRVNARRVAFQGLQSGGAMTWVDDTHLVLLLGDHAFDGVNETPALPQESGADYGKALLLDLATRKAEHIASGLRNPQGLWTDRSGAMWATDQGPQGGDELNRLERGQNYGWPSVTFGTDYGGAPWPLNHTPGEHTGFALPAFVWVPSTSPSSVIAIQHKGIPDWQDDLLVTSLSGQTLWRMRVRDGRVMYAEPLRIGLRLRDLAEGSDGRIVLWNDSGAIISIRPAQHQATGARVFGQCAACHAIADGKTHGVGPDLAGIFRRQVALLPGFEFSPALRRAGGQWSTDRLSDFLRDPQGFASGTKMQFEGIRNAAERNALIAYLIRR